MRSAADPKATRAPSAAGLLAVVGAVSLAVLGGAGLLYRETREGVRRETLAEMTAIAELKARQVDAWRRERLAEGVAVGRDSYFGPGFEAWVAGGAGEPGERTRLLERIAALRDGYGYRKVWLADASGTPRLSVGGDLTFSESVKRAIEEARADLAPHLTDLHGADDGELEIDVVAPLVETRGGARAIGFTVGEWDARANLVPLLAAWPGVGETAESLLVRRVGDAVVTLGSRGGSGAAGALGARALEAAGSGEAVDGRGTAVLAAWRPVPGTRWGLVARVDAAEVFARVHRRSHLVLFAVALLLAAGIAVAVLWWRQQRLRFALRERTAELAARAERKVAEDALRESEERFRATFEHAAVGIAHVSVEGRLVKVNPRLCGILGRSEAELLGVSVYQVTHPDDVSASAEGYARLSLGGGSSFATQKRYLRPDGSVVWANLLVAPLRDPSGTVRYFISVVEDLSGIRRSEAAAREAQLYAEGLVANANVMIVRLDAQGRVLELNEAAERITGYPSQELAGRDWLEAVLPRERFPGARAEREREAGDGAAPRDLEHPILTKGGEERFVSWRNAPVAAGGEAAGTISFGVDTTPRRLAEERAARMSRLYEALSKTNKATVHARDARELFAEVCEAASSGGGFAAVWIAETRPEGGAVLSAAAARGAEVAVEVAPLLEPGGLVPGEPTGLSILSGALVLENDLAAAAAAGGEGSPWPGIVKRHGLASAVALPLRREGQVVGALSVLATARWVFDPELMALLEEIGRDVSFALESFAREERRARAEAEVRETATRLLEAERVGLTGSFEADPRTGRLRWSEGALRLLGPGGPPPATLEEALAIVPAGEREPVRAQLLATARDGTPCDVEYRIVRPDGAVRWARARAERRPGPDGRPGAVVGTVADVTEVHLAEERRLLWGKLFEETSEAIIVTDVDARVVHVNRAFEEITGYRAAEVVGQNPRLLQSGRHERGFYTALWGELLATGRWRGEIWNRRKGGDVYPALLSLTAVKEGDRVTHFIGVSTDVTEQKSAAERVEFLSYHDGLTRLPNRSLFEALLGQGVAAAQRDGRRLAVLHLDVDLFKTYNESFGHADGDRLLADLARRIGSCLRGGDTLARPGGDEFLVLLPSVADPGDAGRVAQKLLEAAAHPIELGGRSVTLTVSVGLALFPDDAHDAPALLRASETAMYHAKEAGRNGFQFFAREMNRRTVEALEMETRLLRAVVGDELFLEFQPQLSLADGRLVGAEALVRWNDPGRGVIGPSVFIPLAEERGLVGPIGEWVLRTACAESVRWRRRGAPPVRVAVNISALQFRQGSFEQRLRKVLDETGADPGSLELELTESVLMKDGESVIRLLGRLRDLGLHIAIDDFGTGWSSLAYLRRFPIDRLKVDRSFVRDLGTDPVAGSIVKTVINLARSLGLGVVAEGVETEEQLAFLKESGCDEAQGFLVGPPGPAGAIWGAGASSLS